MSEFPRFVTHYVHPSRGGELCGMCYREGLKVEAKHKVGEEVSLSDQIARHELTQYVCCKHFGEIMGPLAKKWCTEE